MQVAQISICNIKTVRVSEDAIRHNKEHEISNPVKSWGLISCQRLGQRRNVPSK